MGVWPRARQLLDAGRAAEAEAQLDAAVAFWHEVGASAHLRAAEALVSA